MTWKEIDRKENRTTEESKKLFHRKVNHKWPDRYMVVWKWKDSDKNMKTFWSYRKAKRLYNSIELNGWGLDAA